MSDWSEPEPNDDNEEDESTSNDPRLTQLIGVYRDLEQTD